MHNGMTTRLRLAPAGMWAIALRTTGAHSTLCAAASAVALGLAVGAEAETRRRRIRALEDRIERLEDELSLAVARSVLIEGEVRRSLVGLS
jgi:Ni,Fe-hydrogenase III large subunit